MSVAQADYAITRLYEDESPRGELTDDEANLLLGWAEVQCQAVAAQEHSDPAFEAWTAAFKRLLVSLNRFIGKRATMPPQEQQAVLSGIGAVAEAAGYEIAQPQLEDYLRRHGEWPNDHALSELLGLMKPLPVKVMTPAPQVEPAVQPAAVVPPVEPAAAPAVEPAAAPAVELAAEPASEAVTAVPTVEPAAAEPPSEPTAEITSQEETS